MSLLWKMCIRDRLDIALAVQADGVHVGQSDLPVTVAVSYTHLDVYKRQDVPMKMAEKIIAEAKEAQ